MNKKLMVMSLASVIVSANQECFAEEITVTAEEVMNREDGINNTITLKGINLNAPQFKDKLSKGNTIRLTIPGDIGSKQVVLAPKAFYDLDMKGASLELKFVGKVKLPSDCSGMFARGYDNESPITGIDFGDVDTSDVADMSWMFYQCRNLKSLDLSTFKTEKVQNMTCMFCGCTNLTSLDLSSFKTQNVKNMGGVFWDCENLKTLDLSRFDTKNVEYMTCMFRGCDKLQKLDLRSFDTRSVWNMQYMFGGCSSLNSLNVKNFNTQNVKDMCFMFSYCNGLESLDLSSFNTQNVENMTCMFDGCGSLKSLDLRSFNTKNVKDMGYMFGKCDNLQSLNVSNFNTQNVTDMGGMFWDCKGLTSLDLSSFNTQNVKNMRSMFEECGSLKSLDLSSFDTHNVKNMYEMFGNCNGLESLDLSSFNTQNVENMLNMFDSCTNLTSLTVNKNSFDNEALSQLPNNVKITDIAEKKQNENDKDEELKKALHAKRNELNQIYWRIVANNAIVQAVPKGNHSWIKNTDKYWKSIMEVIGKAIGDCVTRQNEFANPTENGLIVFKASPERYERKHWNAVFLYNYINALMYPKPDAPETDRDLLNSINDRLNKHYDYLAEQAIQKKINNAIDDIVEYSEALGLRKILMDYRETAQKYVKNKNTCDLAPGLNIAEQCSFSKLISISNEDEPSQQCYLSVQCRSGKFYIADLVTDEINKSSINKERTYDTYDYVLRLLNGLVELDKEKLLKNS